MTTQTQFNVRLPRELVERFRIAVIKRRGKLKTELGKEVERAITIHVKRLEDECNEKWSMVIPMSDEIRKIHLKTPGDLMDGIFVKKEETTDGVLFVDFDPVLGPHLPLYGRYGPVGIGYGLSLGYLAHQPLAIFGEGHHRRGGPAALGIGYNDGFAPLKDGDAGIGGAQVYANYFPHLQAS